MTVRILICSCLVATTLGASPTTAAEAPGHWLLSVSDISVSEETCAPHQAVFSVRLSTGATNLLAHPVTVQYTTADGSAVGGVDYTPASGGLTFSHPQQTLTVSVPVTDALVPGPDKTFTLDLSNPIGARLSKPIGTATLHAPTIAKCQSCGLSCDQGDVCFSDVCNATLGCRHLNTSTIGTPWCTLLASGGQAFETCNAAGLWTDNDGDGLADAAEAQGYIDNDANGAYDPGIDIPLLDADPHTPDVYLHYDYTSSSDHDHNPPPEPIQWIVDAFSTQGAHLHVDPQHNAICEDAGDPACVPVGNGARVVSILADAPDPGCAGTRAVSTGQLRAAMPYLILIRPAYHYMVFGHYATCSPAVDPNTGVPYCSACPNDPENPLCGVVAPQKPQPGNLGTAEIYGDDAIVATQPFSDVGLPIPLESWAGLAMHELGHNLGLEHGGADCFNLKPNYVSVMNYNFYTKGIPVAASPGDVVPASCSTDPDCAPPAHCSSATHTCFRIDYGSQEFNQLDEPGATTGIDESMGLLGAADDTDISWCQHGAFFRCPTNGSPIDFDGDGSIETSTIFDVNGDGQKTQLASQDDWTALRFSYQCQPTFANDLPPLAVGGVIERLLRQHGLAASRSPAVGCAAANTSQSKRAGLRSTEGADPSEPAADCR